ncbi:MAG: LysR family transcriptional regulator [Burkholderiales bacterium]|nr:LysR family transcriptional regulator [Burkholderiales bacterium]
MILDALLSEGSVTRASAKLYMSQPAVSHALDRLRVLFDDPLLERQGKTMMLTLKAKQLQPELAILIQSVTRLVALPALPLAELQQTIRISLADYPAAIGLPGLVTRLAAVAPGIRIACQEWREGQDELERLRRGEVDIALSVFPARPDDIHIFGMGTEHYVGVMREGHPMGPSPTLEAFCAYPHIIVSATGATRTTVDVQLEGLGHRRNVGLTVSNFLVVPAIVAQSDHIALLPLSLATHWTGATGLARFTPPLQPPSYEAHLAYHRRHAADVGIRAVADEIIAVYQALLDC